MSSRPSGLGRGLGSLIPNKKPSDVMSSSLAVPESSPLHDVLDTDERIVQLPVGQIIPSPHQPRQVFAEEALNELADSLKEHGLIQPIVVSKKSTDVYELIAGERRLKAAKLAGFKTIAAIVRDFDEQKKMELALIENLQREDLNALEVAMAYKKLEDEFNLSRQELAKKVGKSFSAVNNFIRLLTLRDEVKLAIMEGKLSEGHARTLAGLPIEDQLEGMRRIIEGKLSVREAEKASKEVVVKKHLRNVKFDPEIKEMENEVAAALGTKVEIRRHGGSGQITIKFFSNEELHEILRKIT